MCLTFGCLIFSSFFVLLALYTISTYKDVVVEKLTSYSPRNIINSIKESEEIMNFLIEIIRKSTFQLDRLWLIDPLNVSNSKQIIADVSESKEFSYLMNYYINNRDTKYENFIVDVGGFDGISFSNSFNFFQIGFSGLIVEPLPENIKKMKEIFQYRMKINLKQQLSIIHGAVSNHDGFDHINVFDHLTSNSRLEGIHGSQQRTLKKQIKIETFKLSTLFKKNNVPKNFFAITVDIEGAEGLVIDGLLKTEHRPKFIIIEKNHDFNIPGFHLNF
jgi:FkbM family methyltransferase